MINIMNKPTKSIYQTPDLEEIRVLADTIVCGSAEGYTYGEGEWSPYDDEF